MVELNTWVHINLRHCAYWAAHWGRCYFCFLVRESEGLANHSSRPAISFPPLLLAAKIPSWSCLSRAVSFIISPIAGAIIQRLGLILCRREGIESKHAWCGDEQEHDQPILNTTSRFAWGIASFSFFEKCGDRDVDIIFHAGHEIVDIQVLVIVEAAIHHVAFGLRVEANR